MHVYAYVYAHIYAYIYTMFPACTKNVQTIHTYQVYTNVSQIAYHKNSDADFHTHRVYKKTKIKYMNVSQTTHRQAWCLRLRVTAGKLRVLCRLLLVVGIGFFLVLCVRVLGGVQDDGMMRLGACMRALLFFSTCVCI